MNIVFTGIMGRYPYGGVAWCSLMYLLGLRRLGHDVWYVEDTGECNYDPQANTLATDPAYALNMIATTLEPYGFGDRWCYIDYTGGHHGMPEAQWRQTCADADLFLNLSGGSWFWRDEYAAIPHTAFIDSDPAFTQLAIANGPDWYVEFFRRFGTRFTFGANIGTAASSVPVGDMEWHHTWQPVALDEWHAGEPQSGEAQRLTTIMTWEIESFQDIGGNKNGEFFAIADLPSRVSVPLELAINAPDPVLAELTSKGWCLEDAFRVSRNIDVYRDYIHAAAGELSVAKSTYVGTRSGWFSDRTECFLASGRPAIVQDTGWSAHLPTGSGLFGFDNVEQAYAAIEQYLADPPRHQRAAQEVARAYFADDVVLPALLERATATATRGAR
ncbi:MAG: hypothetical protein JWL83_1913 [Actinomycetia bacterium]|nr:hypothetical protein [Actinomycetes bacterium]